ncbi:MAG TPA: DUF29 domain-containing protein [Geminicoccaceae bacterium]|nr:DUF29 domain-containing protein [Geminicoccaceae bacterium]
MRAEESLYEQDFFAWTQSQAKELRRFARTRPNVPLDLAHIAEEIADLGKAEKNAVLSYAERIIEHLLLLEHSPAQEPRRHWAREIRAFRREVERHLTASLRRELRRRLPQLYARLRRDLMADMTAFGEVEAAARLPDRCPYTLDQILGDWFPDNADRE